MAIRIPFFSVQAEDDPVSYFILHLRYFTDKQKIASRDALPFQEMTQTPYGVMVTTSWGGHLGWFEFGGSRWFVKPVSCCHFDSVRIHTKPWLFKVTNFLNKMAREIDTQIPGVVEHPEKLPGQIASHTGLDKVPDMAPKPEFNPVGRKLDMKLVQ